MTVHKQSSVLVCLHNINVLQHSTARRQ